MKKIITAVVVLLLLAGIGAPYVNGLIMERLVRDASGNLNELYADAGAGAGVSLEVVQFDRGYSSSEIIWKIALGNLSSLYGIDEIIVLERVRHGYTGIVSQSSLEKNPWFTEFVNERLGGDNPLSITSRYALNGQFSYTIELADFSLQDDKQLYEVRPARLVLAGDQDLQRISADLSWQGLTVPGAADLRGISAKSELSRLSPYIWEGEMTYRLDTGTIEEDSHRFSVRDLSVAYRLGVNDEARTLSISSELGAGEIGTDEGTGTDAFVRISVNGVDAEAYEAFMRQYLETANTILDRVQAADGDPEELKKFAEEQLATIGFQLAAAYEKLLKKGLELSVSDLHLGLAAGEITGAGMVRLKRDTTFLQLIPLASQPQQALDIFDLQTSFSLPAELVAPDSMLLTPIHPGMKTGLLVQSGDRLVHRLETTETDLLLNGEKVEL